MSIGVVDDSDFNRELNKSLFNKSNSIESVNSPIIGEVIDSPIKGRQEGSVEVPESLRKIIGETAATNGRQDGLELANNFGVSPSSVSAYTNGSTSTKSYKEPNKELRNHIAKSKMRIARNAAGKLKIALEYITEDKLAEAKVRDISSVARDMAAIVKDMTPVDESNKDSATGPTFVLYSPQFKKEEHFQTIVVNE